MEREQPKRERPLWVKIGLWGLPTRGPALALCWLCVVLAVASAVYGFWDARVFAGVLLGLAALGYWLAVRWVDQHGGWPPENNPARRILGWVQVAGLGLFAILLAAWLLLFGYYQIPQNGMYPALPAGSRLFVLRRPYQDASQVSRGDIIVFSRTENGRSYLYIWRVIGLPGDTIQTMSDDVSVNGRSLKQEKLRTDGDLMIYREMNGAAAYEVAYPAKMSATPPPAVSVTVPANHFFVMGDNRHNARDSRYFGPIPFDSISAKKW